METENTVFESEKTIHDLRKENAEQQAAITELCGVLRDLYPFCHEEGMKGESAWEKAWLKAEKTLEKYSERPHS